MGLSIDRERVIKAIETCIGDGHCSSCGYHLSDYYVTAHDCRDQMMSDALTLLKEQEERERKWMQTIADSQLANAPKDSPMSLDEQLECEYKRGIWDGLEIALNIILEGR